MTEFLEFLGRRRTQSKNRRWTLAQRCLHAALWMFRC